MSKSLKEFAQEKEMSELFNYIVLHSEEGTATTEQQQEESQSQES